MKTNKVVAGTNGKDEIYVIVELDDGLTYGSAMDLGGIDINDLPKRLRDLGDEIVRSVKSTHLGKRF